MVAEMVTVNFISYHSGNDNYLSLPEFLSMITRIAFCILFVLIFFQTTAQTTTNPLYPVKKTWQEENNRNWYRKDFNQDTIPGIGLERAYSELLQDKTGDTILVAVLDSEIDLEHQDLQHSIWTNVEEVPNNGLDDDKNGYIDDIHGWNFLGIYNNDKSIIYANTDAMRTIRAFRRDSIKNSLVNSVSASEYEVAKTVYQDYKKEIGNRLKYANSLVQGVDASIEKLDSVLPDGKLEITALEKIKETDSIRSKYADYLLKILAYDPDIKWVEHFRNTTDSILKISLDFDYNERELIGDDPSDLKNTTYGNSYISQNLHVQTHSTRISTLIAGQTSYEEGVNGMGKVLKILPVVISPYGDQHNKDIALGIRYAVDNGAKVINMSFSKTVSYRNDWILDAIRYADEHEVVVVTSAGNSNHNLEDKDLFPNDADKKNVEVAKNFIVVGSTSKKVDQNFKSTFSSYGKNTVDLFAPGEGIYVTYPYDRYTYDKGTSLSAAFVSGTAGLLFSYYPKLSASQVKEILMNSGTSYDINVQVKQGEDRKVLIPFKELSKSGKVLNVFNALKMAEEITSNTPNARRQ